MKIFLIASSLVIKPPEEIITALSSTIDLTNLRDCFDLHAKGFPTYASEAELLFVILKRYVVNIEHPSALGRLYKEIIFSRLFNVSSG